MAGRNQQQGAYTATYYEKARMKRTETRHWIILKRNLYRIKRTHHIQKWWWWNGSWFVHREAEELLSLMLQAGQRLTKAIKWSLKWFEPLNIIHWELSSWGLFVVPQMYKKCLHRLAKEQLQRVIQRVKDSIWLVEGGINNLTHLHDSKPAVCQPWTLFRTNTKQHTVDIVFADISVSCFSESSGISEVTDIRSSVIGWAWWICSAGTLWEHKAPPSCWPSLSGRTR